MAFSCCPTVVVTQCYTRVSRCCAIECFGWGIRPRIRAIRHDLPSEVASAAPANRGFAGYWSRLVIAAAVHSSILNSIVFAISYYGQTIEGANSAVPTSMADGLVDLGPRHDDATLRQLRHAWYDVLAPPPVVVQHDPPSEDSLCRSQIRPPLGVCQAWP